MCQSVAGSAPEPVYSGQDVANAYQQGYRDCIADANRRAGHDLWTEVAPGG